jgi:polar amino acid transport system substrate-binding protein
VLGFTPERVRWVRVDFNDALAPGKKNFDFDIDQFSITSKRERGVDFSSSYLDVTQAVITNSGSPADGVTTVDGLKELDLGAAVASTSYDAIVDVIQPTKKPTAYDTNQLAVAALRKQQVDAIVVDLPTAFQMTDAQLDAGVIVGQIPVQTHEQLGLLLADGSPLTDCVTQAVDRLRAQGALEDLQFKWLSELNTAPILG